MQYLNAVDLVKVNFSVIQPEVFSSGQFLTNQITVTHAQFRPVAALVVESQKRDF